MLQRDEICDALTRRLTRHDAVLAMWEAGSRAFDRVDDYSDLDVGLLVGEGGNPSVWAAIDETFEELGGIKLRWREPNPVFQGLEKKTYRLQAASRWLQIDLGLFPETATELYNQPERHGRHRVLHDPEGRLRPPPWDADAHHKAMRTRLHHQRMKFALYCDFFRKELARGRTLDAFQSFYGHCIHPLAAVLGMLHRPNHWDFALRYVHEELPAEAAGVLRELCYVAAPEELETKFSRAEALFRDTLARLAEQGLTPLDESGEDIAP